MDEQRTAIATVRPVQAVLLALALAVVIALAAVGCSAPAATGSAPTTRAASLDGTSLTLLVAGPEGMRGRTGFDSADGMLFDLGGEVDPDAVVFVMDGVTLPLDIAWFGADGRLVGTASMATCAAEPCPRTVAPGPFRWAIEAPLGRFADLASGTRLAFPDD